MKVSDLAELLQRYVDDGYGEVEVAAAIQPSWPLAMEFSGVYLEEPINEDDYPCLSTVYSTAEDRDLTCVEQHDSGDEWCDNCRALEDKIDRNRSEESVMWMVIGGNHAEWTGGPYAKREYWDNCDS